MTIIDDRPTQEIHRIRNYEEDLLLIADAFELLVELWPVPRDNTVTLKPEQWKKLRAVILSIPDLIGEIHEGAFGSFDNLLTDGLRAALESDQAEGNGRPAATERVPI